MTAKKAIEFLRIHFEYLKERWKPYPDYNVLEAIRFAISAIEKQIPKKPNKTIDSSWGIKKEVHTCPVCDCDLTEVYFIAPQESKIKEKITYCEAHRQKRATELRKIREKKRLKRKPVKKNKLAEICEIAKSKGMSYGQYMAEQYKKEVMIR